MIDLSTSTDPDIAVAGRVLAVLDVVEKDVGVDDTAHNLPPAAALGMTTVHFTDVEAGLAQIRRLLDLPAT